MSVYTIELTDAVDSVLQKVAASVKKTPQEVIDEQVAVNIKNVFLTAYPEFLPDIDGLTDGKAVELIALLAATKEAFLNK